jgi:hypothetical protein
VKIRRGAFRVLVGKPEERNHLQDPGIDGKIKLKWTFEKGQVVDCCECGNEPFGCVKCGEFLEQLRTCQLLRKDSAPRSYLVNYAFSYPKRNSKVRLEKLIVAVLFNKFSTSYENRLSIPQSTTTPSH